MSDETIGNFNNPVDSSGVTAIAHLLKHVREPKNLLTWLVLTAWLKYMGLRDLIPSITIG
jgi:hypothetical protein